MSHVILHTSEFFSITQADEWQERIIWIASYLFKNLYIFINTAVLLSPTSNTNTPQISF